MKGTAFDYIDGVAIRLLLAQVIGKLFVGHHEISWISGYNRNYKLQILNNKLHQIYNSHLENWANQMSCGMRLPN